MRFLLEFGSMRKPIAKNKFFSPTKGHLNFNQMVEEIFAFMESLPEREYEIIVGCDSSSGIEPFFPIAVVVLRKGSGGRFFLQKVKYHKRKFYNLHQRILEEVYLSCDLALLLREKIQEEYLKRKSNLKYQFKYIHADVGENGVTKDMIKEVVGLIRGNGFEAKIKPEAYVATVVADRYT